ncbi:MAG TPA: BtrH N-terminal domain-containing protein [Candidatus Kapabacteria bacterium]|nr:BtrH N-terminal domain-containing protein [Candidatus Kapabacteria bacterium]HPO63029.1 BtrH N-terminal domain-containing protein [Candidatus Kapabacteria bacterium]
MKKIIDTFIPEAGHHCISNSLQQILHFNGYNISEEMIFGLSSGLGFIYFDIKNSPFPMIGGRINIGDFEENLARRLNLGLQILETSSKKKGYEIIKSEIENGKPAMIYVDMAYLKYLNLPPDAHFGGHSIIVFGLDEEEGIAYISDRDGENFYVTANENECPKDFHKISIEDLELAHSSKEKPYPPKNRLIKFDFSNASDTFSKQTLEEAIKKNLETFLSPPIKNIGVKGIKTFAENVVNWDKFSPEKQRAAAFNCFIMISHIGGTGGGCFRKMYGNFLKEAYPFMQNDLFKIAGEEYIKISLEWDKIANMFKEISATLNQSLYQKISEKLFILYIRENELMERIREVVCS